jgi:hypothetical protein
VDLPVDAHLPTDYIAVERLRLEMYRKLAEARDDSRLDEVVAEMTDRYGEPPGRWRTSSRWPGSGCWPVRTVCRTSRCKAARAVVAAAAA